MRIIGVTGKSGSGKTTFSKMLGERKNVGVINVDRIMVDIKEDNFKDQVKSRNKYDEPVLLSTNLRIFLNKHKIPFKMFMAVKKRMMRKRIERKIAEFKRDGKDAVIIDGVYLTDMVDRKLFDSLVYVKRPYKTRLDALMERDDITKLEIYERDLPYRRNFASNRMRDFDYIVENKYGLDELRQAGQKIYDEVVGIKTFDERYRVSPVKTPTFKDIVTTINKTKKLSRNERIPDEIA